MRPLAQQIKGQDRERVIVGTEAVPEMRFVKPGGTSATNAGSTDADSNQ
jgi:hypothetical protein